MAQRRVFFTLSRAGRLSAVRRLERHAVPLSVLPSLSPSPFSSRPTSDRSIQAVVLGACLCAGVAALSVAECEAGSGRGGGGGDNQKLLRAGKRKQRESVRQVRR
jgi:hypothetical protein